MQLVDPETSAYIVGQNVPLPTESARQTPLTPTASAASAAVDTKKGGIFDVHAMDDNDEPWLSETDHITGWNKEFKSGTYRSMLHGSALRDCQNQVVSLAKAKSVPANMRKFLSWAQRHYRIDVTAPTLQHKTGEPTSVGPSPGGCKDFTHKGSNARFIRVTCKVCRTVRSAERHPPWQDPASCSHRHTDHRGSNPHTRKTYFVDCETYIDSVPREICNVLEATRSASSNRDEEIANRVLKYTTITKGQLDLATRMMLKQGRVCQMDNEHSAMVQLFLDCADRATEPFTAFVSFRERPTHFDDDQTLSLRVVDPIADDGVWEIIDGCNSCCHCEVWRQNAEAKMKVLGPHPFWLHKKATTFNGVGTSTRSGKLKIPMAIRLQESDMVILGCVHSHEISEKTHHLLVSWARQAMLGMTKRVPITLGDYDAQSLEVSRQVETVLFMILLIRDD